MGQRRFGTLQVLGAAALWGTTGPVQVMADLRVAPAAVGAVRILTGGLVLLAWTAARRRSWRGMLPQGAAWPLLAAAGATGAFQAAYFTAVSRTGAALATAIVFGLAPIATGLCSRLIDRSPLKLGWAAGTLCAVAGCGLLLAPDRTDGGADALGVVLSVVAGVCYAVYTVAAKRLTDSGENMVTAVAVTLFVGGLFLTPWLAVAGPGLFTGRALMTVAWLGPVTTALAYMLFVGGLRTVSAATAGTLSLAEPLVAAVLAVGLLHERLSVTALAGCALLAAGLAITSLRPVRAYHLLTARCRDESVAVQEVTSDGLPLPLPHRRRWPPRPGAGDRPEDRARPGLSRPAAGGTVRIPPR
ncbi:DMT family transporter [Actinomadura gamaensis]|uniref:DMT family transporter n=1 Tax=Actinomadura gamaensis TaxID=1763541 RepID=A0ABV9TVQ1_9ACTN